MDHLQSTPHQVLHNVHTGPHRWQGANTSSHPKAPTWRSQLANQSRPASPYHFPPVHHTSPFFPTSPHSSIAQSDTAYGRHTQLPPLLYRRPSRNELPSLRLPTERLSAHSQRHAPHHPYPSQSRPRPLARTKAHPASPPSPSSSATSATESNQSGHLSGDSSRGGSKPALKRPRSWEGVSSVETALPPRLSYKSPFQPWRTSQHNADGHPAPSSEYGRAMKARVITSPASDDNLSGQVTHENCSLRNSSTGGNNGLAEGPTPTSSPNVPSQISHPAKQEGDRHGSSQAQEGCARSQPIKPRARTVQEVRSLAGESDDQLVQQGGRVSPCTGGLAQDECTEDLQVKESSNVSKSMQPQYKAELTVQPEEQLPEPSGAVPMQLEELAQIGALVNMGMLKLTAATRRALASSLAAQQGSNDDKRLQALRALLEGPPPPPSPSPTPSTRSSTPDSAAADAAPQTSAVQRHQAHSTPIAACPAPQAAAMPQLAAAVTAAVSGTTTIAESDDKDTVTQSQDTVTDNDSDSEQDHDSETVTSQQGKHIIMPAVPAPKAEASKEPRHPPASEATRKLDGAPFITSYPVNCDSPPPSPRQSFAPAAQRLPSPARSPSPTGVEDIRCNTPRCPDPSVPTASAFQRLSNDPDLRNMLTRGARGFAASHAGYAAHEGAYILPYAQHMANGTMDGMQMVYLRPGAAGPWHNLPNPVTILPNGQVMSIQLPMLYPSGLRSESPNMPMYQPTVLPLSTPYEDRVDRVAEPQRTAVHASTRVPAPEHVDPAALSEDAIMELRNTVLEVYCNQKELDRQVNPEAPPEAFSSDLDLWQQFLDQVEDSRKITHHLLRETANVYSPANEYSPTSPTPSPTHPTLSSTSPPNGTPHHPTYTYTAPPLDASHPQSGKSPLQNHNLNATLPEPRAYKRWTLPMISPEGPQGRVPPVSYEGYWSSSNNYPTSNPNPKKPLGILRTQAVAAKRSGPAPNLKSTVPSEDVVRIPAAAVQPNGGSRKHSSSASLHLPKHVITPMNPHLLPARQSVASSTGLTDAAHATVPVPRTASPVPQEPKAACSSPAASPPLKTSSPPLQMSDMDSGSSPSRKRGRAADDDTLSSPVKRFRDTQARPAVKLAISYKSPSKFTARPASRVEHPVNPVHRIKGVGSVPGGGNMGELKCVNGVHMVEVPASAVAGLTVDVGIVKMELSQLHPKCRAKRLSPKKLKQSGSWSSASATTPVDDVMEDVDAVEGLLQLAASVRA